MIRSLTARLAAAVLTAAAGLALPAAPAQATYCSGSGVSALVDYGSLGGGTVTGCGSGTTADKAFTSAGFSLTQDPRQPGFVCRVEGKPAAGQTCSGTDAYWGFFVSDDGKGWAYASYGVWGQAVDAGDSVALVWQSSASRRTPGTPPAVATSPVAEPSAKSSAPSAGRTSKKPKPTKRPASTSPSAVASTSSAATASTSTSSTASTSTSPAAEPSTQATGTAGSKPRRTPRPSSATPSPTALPTAQQSPTEEPTSDATVPTAADGDDDGLPGWVPPLAVVLLAAAAGGVALARRAR